MRGELEVQESPCSFSRRRIVSGFGEGLILKRKAWDGEVWLEEQNGEKIGSGCEVGGYLF